MVENGAQPAFPATVTKVRATGKRVDEVCSGMTLIDYFAAKAMQGLIHDILIDQHWEDFLKAKGLTTDEFPDYLGYLSYLTADAMLRQRKIGAA